MRERAIAATHRSAFLGVLTYAVAEPNTALGVIGGASIVALAAIQRFAGTAGPIEVLLGTSERIARRAINLLLLLAVLWTLISLGAARQDTTQVVSIISVLVAMLVVIRLLERKTPRSLAQVLSLSGTLAIGACLTNVTLALGALLITHLLVLLHAVMTYQVYAAEAQAVEHLDESDREVAASAGDAAPAHRSVRLRHDLVGMTAVGGALIIVGASFVFTSLPRGIGGDVSAWQTIQSGGTGRGVVGFRDTVALGERSGILSESTAVVMEVEIVDRGREPGRTASYLLRGAVLDRYDPEQRTWTASDQRSSSRLTEMRGLSDDDLIVQRIATRGSAGDRLFGVYAPMSVEVTAGRRRGRPTESISVLTREITASDLNARVRYEIRSDPTLVLPPRADGDDVSAPQTLRTFAEGAIADEARRVLDDAGLSRDFEARHTPDDFTIARAFQNHLWRTCSYTIEQEMPPPDTDPIEYFLLERREGHCEYFASAMASMCRAVGLNARVVAGYVATERNPASGAFIVRESHAHAWTEVEVAPGQWSTFDASPPSELEMLHRPSGWRASVRRWRDQIESIWVNNVIGFDSDRQAQIVSATLGTRTSERIENWAMRAGGEAIWIPVGIVGALMFMVGVWRMRAVLLAPMRRRRQESVFGDDEESARRAHQAAFYRRLLDTLARAGHAKPDWAGPVAHARGLEGPTSASVEHLGRLYYEIRFGRRLLEADELDRAHELLDGLTESLRASHAR
ncbi:MAG: transglutaminaseTgpA domain-containing protein [Planctomycetota bacterium]